MPSNKANKDNALKAIETTISLNRAVRAKLEEIIAHKKFRRKNVDKERAKKAALSRKINDLNDLKVELDASDIVASAPSLSDIRQVTELIKKINELALADAMRKAGLSFIKKALASASELHGKVKKA
jgi:retron-type reverse transcriptase